MPQTKLKLFTSNRLEILAEQLAQVVRKPLPTPFTPEIIVVQSRGMERWVSMELAALNGISSNCSYPFPNTFLADIFKTLIPDMPEISIFDAEIMAFRLMQLIPRLTGRGGFEDLKNYLSGDDRQLRLYQLADRIADLFDQYQVYRPELLLCWERSREKAAPPDVWQAALWRKLVQGHENLHRARLRERLLERIRDARLDPKRLPARVSLFGISHLPPFHLQAFAELSRLIPINLFLINPCREYWADIVSVREIKKMGRKNPQIAANIQWYHFEEGNRLLAGLGTLGRDFWGLISDLDGEIVEQFEDPPENSILGCVQSDILNLRDRATNRIDEPDETGPKDGRSTASLGENSGWPGADGSIQIHSCHSPMREIEVLHDNLLAMFEEDPDLLPKDIMVMTPDIEAYAPYVRAVFESQTDPALRIPHSIADRSPRAESRILEGFFALLDIDTSRFGATPVLSLLEYRGIRQRFSLTESDLTIITRWVRDTRIRWGIDAENRRRVGLPGFSENTWRAGLNRLLLGYAMPGGNIDMFNGILPYDHIEGSEAQILGNFLNFIKRLVRWSDRLAQHRSLSAWRKTLTTLIDRFFKADENEERELQALRNLLDGLADIEGRTEFHADLHPAVIKAYLQSRLTQNRYGAGFLTGGVTFCAMLPMRSIPFKIICLVGMNNDAYPRDSQPLNFNLIARHPRPGDRSRRHDDKYLFLESILSARRKLYISYVGQSIQDNSSLPPSVLVGELLDTIAKGFGVCGKKGAEKLVTQHRLQPFSPWYFRSGSGLFSYSIEDMLAGMAEKKPPPNFVPSGIPLSAQEAAERRRLDIDSLIRFFSNPARFFLQKRVGIRLEGQHLMPDDRENFVMAALEKYLVDQTLLNAHVAGSVPEDFKSVQRALGHLPHGRVGDLHYNEMVIQVEHFVSKIKAFTGAAPRDPVDVDTSIAGFDLRGRLSGITESGLVNIRYARIRVKDILTSWIYHLILCQTAPPEYPRTGVLICKDFAFQFRMVPDSRSLLQDLLDLFRQGLEAPLHFFPEASWQYADYKLNKAGSDSEATTKAGLKWRGTDSPGKYNRAESDDPYYDLCFRRADPLDEEFKTNALKVFKPLFAYSTEIKLE